MTPREIAEIYVADLRKYREATEAVSHHKSVAEEIEKRMAEARIRLTDAMSLPAAIVVGDKAVIRTMNGILTVPVEHQS